jgi:ATP-binding cassette subfamily B (MDR/TAP) protein 1
LNLRWFRRQIALVDQNPVLFNATIFENIKYGCSDMLDQMSEDETRQRIITASKEAFAHDFISALPHGYDTQVGEKGLQLSGGQRQRIAIARALMKDPKILLLDEATSALDSKSEAAVQAALDAVSKHRTTIVVAHRLSTIRNADNIIVLGEGRVVEQGTHHDLIARKGVYAALVDKQQIEDGREESAVASDRSSMDEIKHGAVTNTGNDENDGFGSVDEVMQSTSAPHQPQTLRKDDSAPSTKQTLSFIYHMSKSDWKLLIFGLACAILAGLGIPA